MSAGREGEPTMSDEGLDARERPKSVISPDLWCVGLPGKRNGLRKFCGPISTLIGGGRIASVSDEFV